MEKKCSKCQLVKSLDFFPNDPNCSDGKRGTCKECRLKQWVPKENEILVCFTCKEEKQYDFFSLKGKQKPYECNVKKELNPPKLWNF
jgi:hypothetical protein